jgi:hypothetical protein
VPLAVLLPLLLVTLLLGGVLVVVAGAAALACSPLLLLAGLVWLVWRAARGPAGKPVPGRAAESSATIAT